MFWVQRAESELAKADSMPEYLILTVYGGLALASRCVKLADHFPSFIPCAFSMSVFVLGTPHVVALATAELREGEKWVLHDNDLVFTRAKSLKWPNVAPNLVRFLSLTITDDKSILPSVTDFRLKVGYQRQNRSIYGEVELISA